MSVVSAGGLDTGNPWLRSLCMHARCPPNQLSHAGDAGIHSVSHAF